MTLPKIIHQIWMNPAENGSKTKPPIQIQNYMNGWLNSGYQYILWDGQSMKNYVEKNLPEYYSIYMGYDSWINRCDAFRYIILYKMGGFYIDADTEKLGELDNLLHHQIVLLKSSESENTTKLYFRSHAIHNQQVDYELASIDKQLKLSNCFMAAQPHHPFFKFCLERLIKTKDVCLVFDCTGPYFLTQAYLEYPNNRDISLIDEKNLPIKHYSNKSWLSAQFKLFFNKYWIYSLIFIVILIVIILIAIFLIRDQSIDKNNLSINHLA